MHVHLINLDRSKDRLVEFCDLNRHLTSVSRFPGIDGSALNIDDLARQGTITPDLIAKDYFTLGALGCALSNLTLWDRAIANNRIVTVSEDDAIFNYQFEQRAEELLKSLPEDWDLIYWGFNFDMFICFDMLPGVSPCVVTFDQNKMRAATAEYRKNPVAARAFRAIWVFGTPCYSLSPKGAKVLRKKILPLRPQVIQCPEANRSPPFSRQWRTVGIDSCINALHREIKSYVCFPPLVITKNLPDRSTTRGAA